MHSVNNCTTVPNPMCGTAVHLATEKSPSLKALAHKVLQRQIEKQPVKECTTSIKVSGTGVPGVPGVPSVPTVPGVPLNERCLFCLHWTQRPGRAWWDALCSLHGHIISTKSRCLGVLQ